MSVLSKLLFLESRFLSLACSCWGRAQWGAGRGRQGELGADGDPEEGRKGGFVERSIIDLEKGPDYNPENIT